MNSANGSLQRNSTPVPLLPVLGVAGRLLMVRPDALVGPVCLCSINGCLSLPLSPSLDPPDSPGSADVQTPSLALSQSLDIAHLAQDEWGGEWEGNPQGPARGQILQVLGIILCQVSEPQRWERAPRVGACLACEGLELDPNTISALLVLSCPAFVLPLERSLLTGTVGRLLP